MIDRGGLWWINDDIFSLFVIMEEEIRQKLTKDSASKFKEGTKTEILVGLMQNEELLFECCIVVRTTVNDDSSPVLLQQIAELYLTVRGFAFATSCLELYKQAHKKHCKRKKHFVRNYVAMNKLSISTVIVLAPCCISVTTEFKH